MRALNRPSRGGIISFVAPIIPLMIPAPAAAHVSEQGLVLLLPTGHYIAAGVFSVVASIILISLAPRKLVNGIFRPLPLPTRHAAPWIAVASSLLGLICFISVVIIGIVGPRDPLTNLLPLTVWVGFWIILFSAIGLTTDLWRWLNPWTGLASLTLNRDGSGLIKLPENLGVLPALLSFMAFAGFYVADPAPSDPDRLALFALLYWVLTFFAIILFGASDWMARGEAFSVLFHLIARCGIFGNGDRRGVGLPGWNLFPPNGIPVTLGVFAVVILGVGSFDGLKETFWWMGQIGINPLAFPGRSFVVGTSLIGLMLSCLCLLGVFGLALWLGERAVRLVAPTAPKVSLPALFCRFGPTLLPIALSYHISHFLITFLVDGQYLLAALGDPLASGRNYFGLGDLRVTTGFLGTPESVKAIWLTQAMVVVTGHIIAVLASHHVALALFETPRRAILSQIPLALFMIAYTFFGLWLLATPRAI